MTRYKIACALFVALVVGGPEVAVAQDSPPPDSKKSLTGVTTAQAARLKRALAQPSHEKHDEEGIRVDFAWSITGQGTSNTGWFLRGNMAGKFEVTDKASHEALVGWLVTALAASNQQVQFSYDRGVLIEYYASKAQLDITIEEGSEEDGKYNIVAKATKSFNANASVDPVSVASPNFGFSVGADKSQLSVAVTGMPYALAPRLYVSGVGEGHLRLGFGLAWESRATITGVPVQGTTSDVKFDLSYGNKSVVKGDIGVANGTFKSTLSAKSDGNGILGAVYYDETETALAYELNLSASQEWFLQVADVPLTKVGSAHWEKKFPVKAPNLPATPVHGLEALPQPLIDSILRANTAVDPTQALATRMAQNLYIAPDPAPAATPAAATPASVATGTTPGIVVKVGETTQPPISNPHPDR